MQTRITEAQQDEIFDDLMLADKEELALWLIERFTDQDCLDYLHTMAQEKLISEAS
jgi:hypothetical protein